MNTVMYILLYVYAGINITMLSIRFQHHILGVQGYSTKITLMSVNILHTLLWPLCIVFLLQNVLMLNLMYGFYFALKENKRKYND